MVLKKPYAFLIKHFKLIHLILCVPVLYLLLKTGNIASFLSEYIHSSYYTSAINIAGTYINYIMYLAILFILLVTIAIYFLMRQKEKSTKFYFLTFAFYIVLFVLISLAYGALTAIEETTVTSQTVRMYRDIAYIAYVPQFFFLGYMILRGIGFDLKSFNFEVDVRELEITDVDSEEFELEFGKDIYKYKRSARRFLREFRYYFLENKVTFFALLGVLTITIGTILYLNFGVYHKTYRQQQKLNHNGLIIQVVDSELSNLDLGGRVISKDKYYMAVSLKIQNLGKVKARLDYENFKLKYEDTYLMPTLDRGSYFLDLGIPYTRNMEILPDTQNTYVITYELDPSIVDQKFELRILESLESTMMGITPVYKEVRLNYETIKEKKEMNTHSFGKILELSSTRLGVTQLQFTNYEIVDQYAYEYKKCSGAYCSDLKGMVMTDPVKHGLGKTLFVLNTKFSLDPTSPYYQNRKNASSFIKDFMRVRYQIGEEVHEDAVLDLTPSELSGKWVLVVPSALANASKIDLLLELRGRVFVMNIK